MTVKEKLQKIAKVCKVIFGYGIMLTLFVGGLTFFGYIIALCIGGGDGGTGEMIANFLYKTVTPIIIYASTVCIVFGLICMYLAGETALTPDSKKKKNKAEAEKSFSEKTTD